MEENKQQELFEKSIQHVPVDEQKLRLANQQATPLLDKALSTQVDWEVKGKPPEWAEQYSLKRAFIGVDNGISGSVGIIYSDGTYEFFKSPVIKQQDYTKKKKLISRIVPNKFADLLNKVGPGSMVFIERPMINSTRFNASMSAIRAYEMTITILETLGLPYETIDSKDWQRTLLPQGVSGDELKKASFDVGNRLFPSFKEVKHPDRDGLLIALHCKNKHK